MRAAEGEQRSESSGVRAAVSVRRVSEGSSGVRAQRNESAAVCEQRSESSGVRAQQWCERAAECESSGVKAQQNERAAVV